MMAQNISEIAAMCVGLVGLIGAASTTGLPMWKVTAFIGSNIIVMETRWEGLWMNCFRQANIRMQCKVYDSLLFLPPELQAARGLMCCSVALSGIGLLVALGGMRCIACFQGNVRAKTIILMVAGAMQFMACICVFIPVSWTGHTIIRDFYNPLLIDAQRRELGEALYIGWVSGGCLFASAILFVCRRMPSDKEQTYDMYHPVNYLGHKPALCKPTVMTYHPISSISSLRSQAYQPFLQNNSFVGQQIATPLQSNPEVMNNNGAVISKPVIYNPGLPENPSLLYQGSLAHHSSMRSSNHVESLYRAGNSLFNQNTPPYSSTLTVKPTMSSQSSFYPVPQTPVFIGYKSSTFEPETYSRSRAAVYI